MSQKTKSGLVAFGLALLLLSAGVAAFVLAPRKGPPAAATLPPPAGQPAAEQPMTAQEELAASRWIRERIEGDYTLHDIKCLSRSAAGDGVALEVAWRCRVVRGPLIGEWSGGKASFRFDRGGKLLSGSM